MARVIKLMPHDPAWLGAFQAASESIVDVLAETVCRIHHIGSTAVPRLLAKPTIDILVEVRFLAEVDAADQQMEALGYSPKGENGIAGRRYFQKLQGDDHLLHVQIFEIGHPAIDAHLNFRDYLISHPEAARQYEALKMKLVARFADQPRAYTQGKHELIQHFVERAAVWRRGSNGSEKNGTGSNE
jgi:GrpB-like predicted nucleotidyltransferase (UPF0157 family)